MKAELITLISFVLELWWISRHGDPLGADVSDDEGGVGPPEEEDEFYPESNPWEAGEEEDEEEEAKVTKPPPPPAAAAITEKVASSLSCLFLLLAEVDSFYVLDILHHVGLLTFFLFDKTRSFFIATYSLCRSTRRRACTACCRPTPARWSDPRSAARTSTGRTPS